MVRRNEETKLTMLVQFFGQQDVGGSYAGEKLSPEGLGQRVNLMFADLFSACALGSPLACPSLAIGQAVAAGRWE